MLNVHDQHTFNKIASNWRLTPATMANKLTHGEWIPAPWLQYASMRVANAIARGNGRIIISAPPRHGKTQLIAKWTPVWTLENFPKRNVILTGYGADLSEQSGRWVRDTIRDFGNEQGILKARIRQDVSKVAAFLTETDGYMFSVGLGGAITGRGAHVLLIDDYIKEIKEALSQANRDYIWNWFVTTAMTRLEPGATVIIIATRWHSDDLIGRILRNFPGQWENICFPAFATEQSIKQPYDNRVVGEPLFKQRYDVDFLQSQQELLGSVFFHALYQQGPVDEVMKFTNPEWLKVVHQALTLADDFEWVRVWDLAATEDGGDYTCGTLCGYSKSTNNFIIGNVVRRQMSPGQVEDHVRKIAVADGENVKIAIEQEPGSSGKSLVNHYQTNVLKEFSVTAVPATKSKLIRSQPFLAAAEAGKVYLLDEGVKDYAELQQEGEATWHKIFKGEFEVFPNGPQDDQIDTAAAGYNFLSGKKQLSVTWGRTKQTEQKINSRKIRQASFIHAREGRRSSIAWARTIRS
jgi:predicted phage terminase large subunit-like protein